MRLTISDIQDLKTKGEKIPTITAYDYTSARKVDSAGIPLVLVGDTLGQVVLGYDSDSSRKSSSERFVSSSYSRRYAIHVLPNQFI